MQDIPPPPDSLHFKMEEMLENSCGASGAAGTTVGSITVTITFTAQPLLRNKVMLRFYFGSGIFLFQQCQNKQVEIAQHRL